MLNSVLVNGRSVVPSKIVCVGRNYVEHIAELGNDIPDDMVVFIKPNSAISSVLSASQDEPLHYETEIALLFENDRFTAVAPGLDLTKRALQSALKAGGLPWERAKAFDGSALFGEFVDLPVTLEGLVVELTINDLQVQHGGVELMMYKPQLILEELRSFMTLNNGDIVMTGTPKGVGKVNAGDVFKARILEYGSVLTEVQWRAQD